MKKIIVYVEGPSDRLAMEELLASLLARLVNSGIAVEFIPTEQKRRLMVQVPTKAVNILLNDPHAEVVALPDLYPPNVGFPHRTIAELAAGLHADLARTLARKQVGDARLPQRFHVFCFKHDLEALVLAAEAAFAARLGVNTLSRVWSLPVENQNHDRPPKRIVEEVFRSHNDRYVDTIDAPLILGATELSTLVAACSQSFAPFVRYLESFVAPSQTAP
jgi:hypothetical protein